MFPSLIFLIFVIERKIVGYSKIAHFIDKSLFFMEKFKTRFIDDNLLCHSALKRTIPFILKYYYRANYPHKT